MAALSGIRRRIRSVKGIHQITKAQQLVAASKLRKVEAAARGPQDYTKAARELLARLATSPEVRRFPLFESRTVKRAMTIVIAGDRGMAGAYNANIIRALAHHIRELGVPQTTVSIGRRASLHLAHARNIGHIASYDVGGPDPDTTIAQPVLREAIDAFRAGDVDRVDMIYTAFVSSVKQEVRILELLPIVPPSNAVDVRDFEPEAEELIAIAAKRVLEADLLQAVLDARASEEAARMVAMMNATDNASDLIDDLTLSYNNARQAAITQELAEITAGAEAITA